MKWITKIQKSSVEFKMLEFIVDGLMFALASTIKVPRAITKNSIQTNVNKLTHFLKNDAVNNNLEKSFTIIIKSSSWAI